MSISIKPGENAILVRNFYKSDGVTTINVADLSSVEIILSQGNKNIANLKLNDGQNVLRTSGDSSIVLELTSEMTSKMNSGNLLEKWKIFLKNSEFIAQGGVEIHILNINEVVIE